MTFTTIVNNDDLQNLSLFNELVNAYSQRHQIAGYAGQSAVEAGFDITAQPDYNNIFCILYMQKRVEQICTIFVDSDAIMTDLAAIPAFTWTTLKTAASIPNGFRRAVLSWPTDWTDYNEVSYSYGTIQPGDIIGPWLWVDLQNCFKKMIWTTMTSLGASTGAKASEASNATCATAKTDHDTYWSSAPFDTVYSILFTRAEAYTSGGSVTFRSVRSRGTPYVSSVPTLLNSTYDIYLKPVATSVPGSTFNDIDSLGYVQDKLFKIETNATPSNAATRTGAMYGELAASPVDNAGLDCTTVAAGNQKLSVGQSQKLVSGTYYGELFWIFKWAFTYQ